MILIYGICILLEQNFASLRLHCTQNSEIVSIFYLLCVLVVSYICFHHVRTMFRQSNSAEPK